MINQPTLSAMGSGRRVRVAGLYQQPSEIRDDVSATQCVRRAVGF